MARVCHYHQRADAANSCAQCGVPICKNCIQLVGPIPVCPNCAPAMHARQQQMAGYGVNSVAATQQPGSYAPQPGSYPSQPGNYPPQAGMLQSGEYGAPPPYPQANGYAAPPTYPQANGYAAPSYQASVQQQGGNVPLGLMAGLVIGIIASIVVLKIYFYGQIGISLLYIGVGYGIGFGIHKFTGRGGTGLAAASVAIMMISLLVAHLVYASDELHLAIARGILPAGTSVMEIFPQVVANFNAIHWVFIAIGLYSCWRTMEQQSA